MIGDVCGVLCPGLSCSAHCRQADNTSRGLKRADDVEGGRHRGQMIPVVDNSQFPQFINYRNKKIFFLENFKHIQSRKKNIKNFHIISHSKLILTMVDLGL